MALWRARRRSDKNDAMTSCSIFIVDCRKIKLYESDPAQWARYIGGQMIEGSVLKIGPLYLGKVKRAVVEGPVVRVYVKLEEAVELGTLIMAGGN